MANTHPSRSSRQSCPAEGCGLPLTGLTGSDCSGCLEAPRGCACGSTPLHEGFTRPELRAAFEAVQSSEHWKGPVDGTVEREALPVTLAAVGFYAGGGAQWEPANGNQVRVTAPGYWAQIGA